MKNLDLIDKKILYELDHNSRQPISELAKKLRIGRDRVAYRINQLCQNGIIKKFTVTTNPYKIGLTVYKTYLKLENNKPRISEFVEFLNQHPRVYWIAECDGTWNLIFSTFAKNPKDFSDIQDRILSKFTDIVMEFNVYSLVDVWFFHKNYLLNKGTSFFFFGGVPEEHKLDALDFNILKMLSHNARINVVDIARELGTTAIIVKYRIKKLESIGVIAGYRIDIDLEKIGMTFFKVQLYLKNYDTKLEKQFREYCTLNPFITYYIRQIGDCKLELELEVKDYNQFNGIINDLSEKFSKFIRNVESILVRREHFKWVPYDILDEQKI